MLPVTFVDLSFGKGSHLQSSGKLSLTGLHSIFAGIHSVKVHFTVAFDRSLDVFPFVVWPSFISLSIMIIFLRDYSEKE